MLTPLSTNGTTSTMTQEQMDKNAKQAVEIVKVRKLCQLMR